VTSIGTSSVDEVLQSASHGGEGEGGGYDHVLSASLVLAASPNDMRARFALACVLAQAGLHDDATAIATTLTGDAANNVGAGSACEFSPATIAAVRAKPSPLRTAAQRVLGALANNDAEAIAPYLDAHARWISTCSVCDEDRTTTVPLAQFLPRRGDELYNAPVFLFCSGQCCSGPTGYLSHSASSITSICFRGPASSLKLESVSSLDG
jgi:hypothetical protein